MTNVLGNHKLLFRKGPRELTRVSSAATSPISSIIEGFEKKADMKAIIKPVKDFISSVPGKVKDSFGKIKQTVGDLGASGKGAQDSFMNQTPLAGVGDKVKNTKWGKGKTYAGLGAAGLGLTALGTYKGYQAVDNKIGTPAPTQEW